MNGRDTLLDASAILAFLNREPGGEQVEGVLANACLSPVNAGEVLAVLLRRGVPLSEAAAMLLEIDVLLLDYLFQDALAGERFSAPEYRKAGLSIGDRACLGTALHRGLRVLTADRDWRKLGDVGVAVQYIR